MDIRWSPWHKLGRTLCWISFHSKAPCCCCPKVESVYCHNLSIIYTRPCYQCPECEPMWKELLQWFRIMIEITFGNCGITVVFEVWRWRRISDIAFPDPLDLSCIRTDYQTQAFMQIVPHSAAIGRKSSTSPILSRTWKLDFTSELRTNQVEGVINWPGKLCVFQNLTE